MVMTFESMHASAVPHSLSQFSAPSKDGWAYGSGAFCQGNPNVMFYDMVFLVLCGMVCHGMV